MSTTTELVAVGANGVIPMQAPAPAVPAISTVSASQIRELKATLAPTATPEQFELFIANCVRTGLDPIARQIYCVIRGGGGGKMSIQTSIDGFRLIAARSGRYRGQAPVLWCGQPDEDGRIVWQEVWTGKGAPFAAKVSIYVAGFEEPICAVARTAAYIQSSNSLWQTMPDVMIAKCAECLALRKAFPQELSGVYGDDEMGQADNPPPAPAATSGRAADRAPLSGPVLPAANAAPAAPPPNTTGRRADNDQMLRNAMDAFAAEAERIGLDIRTEEGKKSRPKMSAFLTQVLDWAYRMKADPASPAHWANGTEKLVEWQRVTQRPAPEPAPADDEELGSDPFAEDAPAGAAVAGGAA